MMGFLAMVCAIIALSSGSTQAFWMFTAYCAIFVVDEGFSKLTNAMGEDK